MSFDRTELRHETARALDTLSPADVLHALWKGQAAAALVVERVIPELVQAADIMARTVGGGGRLVYVGAGSSGLMAMADALELPGTYGLNAGQIVILMAGGLPGAPGVHGLPGGPEDDADAGRAEIVAAGIGAGDCILAAAASGSTPYVIGAAEAAARAGAKIIGFANNQGSALLSRADVPILLPTPPEVVAGSTRMGAGTAQKIAFNMVSTLMGVMLGHVYDGHMVNLKADNQKLRARATRMVSEISGIGADAAEAHLASAAGSVKIAVLLAAGAAGIAEAETLLAANGQHLRAALRSLQESKGTI